MSAHTMVKRPTWALWCEMVSRESKNDASVDESQRVRRTENLVSWLRALNSIRQDVEAKTGDANLRLRAMRPLPGEQPDALYLNAKRDYERHHAGRVRVMRGLDARTEECRFLLDQAGDQAKYATVGHLIGSMCKAEELLCRDDIEGALGLLRMTLHKAIKEDA